MAWEPKFWNVMVDGPVTVMANMRRVLVAMVAVPVIVVLASPAVSVPVCPMPSFRMWMNFVNEPSVGIVGPRAARSATVDGSVIVKPPDAPVVRRSAPAIACAAVSVLFVPAVARVTKNAEYTFALFISAKRPHPADLSAVIPGGIGASVPRHRRFRQRVRARIVGALDRHRGGDGRHHAGDGDERREDAGVARLVLRDRHGD